MKSNVLTQRRAGFSARRFGVIGYVATFFTQLRNEKYHNTAQATPAITI
jgi:hypothetical protein